MGAGLLDGLDDERALDRLELLELSLKLRQPLLGQVDVSHQKHPHR